MQIFAHNVETHRVIDVGACHARDDAEQGLVAALEVQNCLDTQRLNQHNLADKRAVAGRLYIFWANTEGEGRW